MTIKAKRIVSAWVLLAVFQTALLATMLHRHQPVAETLSCIDCHDHVHHSGHFSASTLDLHNCLICQFLGISYVDATAILVGFVPANDVRMSGWLTERICNAEPIRHCPRAPPQQD
ncbi:MAG: hypothetical protein IJ764_01705 [Bacteroidales bacterium]|nr:hypothetical protein [Bacteroidales bacterium]